MSEAKLPKSTLSVPEVIPIYLWALIVKRAQKLIKVANVGAKNPSESTDYVFEETVKRCIAISNGDVDPHTSASVEAFAWMMLLFKWSPFFNESAIMIARDDDDGFDYITGEKPCSKWCTGTQAIYEMLKNSMPSIDVYSPELASWPSSPEKIFLFFIHWMNNFLCLKFTSKGEKKTISVVLETLRRSPQCQEGREGIDDAVLAASLLEIFTPSAPESPKASEPNKKKQRVQ